MSQFKIFNSVLTNVETVSHELGTVFKATDATMFERFLILGTFGTFYANQQEVTDMAMKQAQAFINRDPIGALHMVDDVVRHRLAFRRDPALFALAALSLPHIPLIVRKSVREIMAEHVITGTDILHWAAYRKALGGKWNSLSRGIINDWFLRDRPDLPLQAVKYGQRDGWSLRDLLRLAHPKTEDIATRQVMDWIAHPEHRMMLDYDDQRLLEGYKEIRRHNADDAASLIRHYRLPREAVPSELLNMAEVWDALMDDMPSQAFLRNLGTLGARGILENRLNEAVRKVRMSAKIVHPMQMLVSWNQYIQGHSDKGSQSWQVIPDVAEALEMAYIEAFDSLPVIENVRPLIALDVSGSMTSPAMGLPMSCIAVELCMVEVLAHQFPNATFAAYSDAGTPGSERRMVSWMMPTPEHLPLVNVRGKKRVDLAQEIERYRRAFCGTDCAIPLRMAEKDTSIDAVISITDSETGYGESPNTVIQRIYAQGRTEFRHAVVGLAMNNISIANPKDHRQLDTAGASANLPQVLARFIEGSAGLGLTPVDTQEGEDI